MHNKNPSEFEVEFQGERLLVLGTGSIATTFLPLLVKHISIKPQQIIVLSDDPHPHGVFSALGIEHIRQKLTPDNYVATLSELVGRGDCVTNLTGGVSARDLVRFCLTRGIDYIDTSNERWEHGALHNDAGDYASQWDLMISARDDLPKTSTALVSHGANPGIVSHFAKQAVEDLAYRDGLLNGVPPSGVWANLARQLRIRALHISERDTQRSKRRPKLQEFFNTWSIEGMVEECFSGPIFAWGSLEPHDPEVTLRRDRVYDVARFPGIAKDRAIRSWLPSHGGFDAMVIPHEETFSIAELFTTGEGGERYQPTVLFAYRPCDDAYSTLHSDEIDPEAAAPLVLMEEIVAGQDELGILVLREEMDEVYWYGSTLDIHEARSLVPHCNATSLQVAAGVLGGLVWLLENPGRGLVSAEDADHKRVLEVARPYLGKLEGTGGVWSRPKP